MTGDCISASLGAQEWNQEISKSFEQPKQIFLTPNSKSLSLPRRDPTLPLRAYLPHMLKIGFIIWFPSPQQRWGWEGMDVTSTKEQSKEPLSRWICIRPLGMGADSPQSLWWILLIIMAQPWPKSLLMSLSSKNILLCLVSDAWPS